MSAVESLRSGGAAVGGGGGGLLCVGSGGAVPGIGGGALLSRLGIAGADGEVGGLSS